jgi:putative ABC transport system permease protein
MNNSTFKIAWRNLVKDRQFSVLNLLGLSAGLACVILIYLWVNDELKVDRFHATGNRLFQVMKNKHLPNEIETVEYMPGLLAGTLAKEMPEVEYAVSVHPAGVNTLDGIATVAESNIRAKAKFADNDYFKVFSYPLIYGDKNTVLSNKNGVVLSAELAKKLFGSVANAIGKPVDWSQELFNGNFFVAGIFENIPANSSVQFDILFNYELCLDTYPQYKDWENGGPAAYVVLREKTGIAQFNKKIGNLIKSRVPESNATLFISKYSDQYLRGVYENGVQAGGRIEYVNLFSIIAVFILVLACINFMNLSTAKASRRMKEVGIRKTIGASRKSLVVQYLSESVLMSCLALVAAIGLVQLFLPGFNEISGKQLHLDWQPGMVLPVVIVTLFTGIVAGSYPALYLSGFKPVKVLKGMISTSAGESWTRKGLVTFQFTVSAILIVSVIVIYKQTGYIQNKNLGFNKHNIIFFPAEGKLLKNHQPFVSTIKTIPGVVQASVMGGREMPGARGFTSILQWEGKDPSRKIGFGMLDVGYGLFELLGYQMAAGRTFSNDFKAGSTEIIFNEAAIEAMGLTDPIGKTVKYKDVTYQIVGVAKDFHFESLYEKVKPCFFRLTPDAKNIMIKLQAGKERDVISKLQQYYAQFNKGIPFDYQFLDKEFEALYTAENRVAALSKYFAGMAILISCLGLFGLMAFTAEKRLKEIVIRKVLGASFGQLTFLLSADFFKLVLVATFIAFPLSWWVMNQWLDSFAYRIQIGADTFLATAGAMIMITLFTISFQTIKAALSKPIKNLRSE